MKSDKQGSIEMDPVPEAGSGAIALKAQPKFFDARSVALLRTMYLVQGLNPSDIERQGLGFTASQVSQLARRQGWTEMRKSALLLADQKARASHDLAVTQVTQAIAAESEELCFKALTQTRAGLEKGGLEGAKQAQAASSTLKNLAGVAQAIRNPALQTEAKGGGSVLNVFMLRAGDVAAEAKEAKQVTEIEARPSA